MLAAIIGGGLLVALAHGVIKKYAPEFTTPLLTAFAVAIIAAIVPQLLSLVNELTGIELDRDGNISILVKVLCVNIIAGTAADICSDSGIKSAGNLVLLAGQVASVGLAMPVLRQLIALISGLLQ